MKRLRAAFIYLACWLPFGACYSLTLFLGERSISPIDALIAGMTNSLIAAALGVPVMAVTRRGLARNWSRARLTLIAVGLTFLYSAAWTTFVSLSVIQFAPADAAAMYLRWGMWWQFVTGLFLGGAVVGVCIFLHNERRLQEQQARAVHAEALRSRAELAALRAQLQPHFLFNALHSISAVLRSDPRAAEHALEQLGSMLRYSLGVQRDEREEVTLAEELEFARAYLAIEQLRLGDRLRVEETIDPDALECAVLAFTLQPLVENAVRHGIAPRPQGGTIRITAATDETQLHVDVADDGVGGPADVGRAQDASRGVGIRLVRQRLLTRYGSAATLRIDTAVGRGFQVSIVMPLSVPPVPPIRRPSPSDASHAVAGIAS